MGRVVRIFVEEPVATADGAAWRVPPADLRRWNARVFPIPPVHFSRSHRLTDLLLGPFSPFTVSAGAPEDASPELQIELASYLRRPDGTAWTMPVAELAERAWRDLPVFYGRRIEACLAHHFGDGAEPLALLEPRLRQALGPDVDLFARHLHDVHADGPVDWTSETTPARAEDTRPAAFQLRLLPPDYLVIVTWTVPFGGLLGAELAGMLDGLARYAQGARATLLVDGAW